MTVELTLAALRSGALDGVHIGATPETLAAQAAVARSAGRPQLAEALERAAELARVPAEVLLDVYTAMRPRRSTAAELEAWAERLESEYRASRCAAFLREAASVYVERGLVGLGHEQADTQV